MARIKTMDMYVKSFKALLSAMRLLFTNRRALALIVTSYVGLLTSLYLFVSTREATISQLFVTFLSMAAAPALFFLLQSLSVTYASDGLVRKAAIDGLKIFIVSLPVIALTAFAAYGLSKLHTHLTIVTTVSYLLIAVIAPLLAIQLWIATSNTGLRSLVKRLGQVLVKTFAPHSVLVYACGFLIFAVAPYLLLRKSIATERAWLEISLLTVRLAASATLMLIGWVTTVGAISILSRDD
jgi:hypothetical protein